jgi:hypothetical protein
LIPGPAQPQPTLTLTLILTVTQVWSTGNNQAVTVTPPSAVVAKGERVVCELAYHPLAPNHLDQYRVSCSIINGDKYTLGLTGHGHRPKLNFSFYNFDFGPCFLYSTGMDKYQVRCASLPCP